MSNDVGSLEDRYRDTRRQLLVVQRRLASAQEEVTLITEDLQKARSQRDAAENRNQALVSQEKSDTETEALRVDNGTLRTRVTELEGERELSRKEIASLKAQLEKAKADAKRESANLRSHIQEEKAKSRSESEALRTEIEKEKARAKRESDALKSELEKARAETKKENDFTKGLREQVEALRKEKEQWASQLKAKDRRISILEEELILTISEAPVKKEEVEEAMPPRATSTNKHQEPSPSMRHVPQKRPVTREEQIPGPPSTNKRPRTNDTTEDQPQRKSSELPRTTNTMSSSESAATLPPTSNSNSTPTSTASMAAQQRWQHVSSAASPSVPSTAVTAKPVSPQLQQTSHSDPPSTRPPTDPRVVTGTSSASLPVSAAATSVALLPQRPPASQFPYNTSAAVNQPPNLTGLQPSAPPSATTMGLSGTYGQSPPSAGSLAGNPAHTNLSRPVQSNPTKPAGEQVPPPNNASGESLGQANTATDNSSSNFTDALALGKPKRHFTETAIPVTQAVASTSNTQISTAAPNTNYVIQPTSQPNEVTIRESLNSRISYLRPYPLPGDSEPHLTLSKVAQKILAQDWFTPSDCVCQSTIMSYRAGRGIHDMMWLEPVHQPGFPQAPGKQGTLLSITPPTLIEDLGNVGLWTTTRSSGWTYYGHYKVEICAQPLTASEFQRLVEETRRFWIDNLYQCRQYHNRSRAMHSAEDAHEARLRIEAELRRGTIRIDVLSLRCVTYNPTLTKLLQDTARRKSRRPPTRGT